MDTVKMTKEEIEELLNSARITVIEICKHDINTGRNEK